jgi:hypothetical protein
VGILLWDFPFPMAVVARGCRNVEIAAAISKGWWAGMGNLVLVFLAVHSPAFPQPLCCHAALLFAKLSNSFLFAACILIAALTSLSTPARRSISSMVNSSLSDPATAGVCRSISHGVVYH